MQSALYAIARPSVCPSVTRVDQSKTVEVRIMQLSPQSSFCGMSLIQNSDGFPLSGGVKQRWDGDMQLRCVV